jgi:hypothetical protein
MQGRLALEVWAGTCCAPISARPPTWTKTAICNTLAVLLHVAALLGR